MVLKNKDRKKYIEKFTKSAGDAFFYTEYILGGRFEAGEKIISTDPHWSWCYANLLGERWEMGEKAIATDASSSVFYAYYVLRGRFELGEEAINKNPKCKENYEKSVLNDKNVKQGKKIALQ